MTAAWIDISVPIYSLLAIPFVSVFYIVMEGFSEGRGESKGIASAHSKVAVPKTAD